MYGREIVRALVSAFNVHNYARNTVKTNFTLQSRGGEDYIVVSFDKGMKDYQCSEYLGSIKRKIIREFYGIEESNDKEILDTAKKDFDVTSFPFNYIYKGDWSVDKQGRIEFVAPVDQGVIFNLKSHLAASLAKGVLEDMRVSSTAVPFNKKKYLWCGEFDNGRLSQQFEREFLSRMENRYGYRNGFKNPLKVKGNSVYIRDVFDDARFIDSVARYITWLKGMGLQADSKVRGDVKAFKGLIMEFIDQPTEIIIAGFVCASPLGREEASVLIPLVLDGGRKRILTNEEALKLNHAFNGAVFNDLYGGTQGELAINGGNGLYSIDFSNPDISYCVITKIIESSVINKDHELSIDPELRLQALSPSSPTPPPTPVLNGPSSGLTGASIQGFPTRSQDGTLKESPRQGFMGAHSDLVSVDQVDVPGTSKGFPPSTQVSSTAVNPGISGPSPQSLSAAQNVPASTNLSTQQPNPRSSSAPSAGFSSWNKSGSASTSAPSHWSLFKSTPAAQRWSFSSPLPPPFIPISSNVSGSQPPTPSRTSSWKGANESGSAWTSQPIGFWSSSASSAGFSSWKGAAQNVSAALSQDLWSQQCQSSPEPGPSGLSWNKSGSAWTSAWSSSVPSAGLGSLQQSRPSSWKDAQAGANISEKEKKLIEALLYTLNLMNYTLDGVCTNFFAKDGKIISLLHDNVDRKEYLQEVRDYIIEEYCEDEEKARKLYDLDEFPFKFSPDTDYKKNQNDCDPKKTVVANISSGALSNLKILFSRKSGKTVDAINIDWVKEVEKHEKEKWVGIQLKDSTLTTEKAIKKAVKSAYIDCFPDEGAMKIIPIALEEGEYVLDRSRDSSEVRSLQKALPPLTTKEEVQRFLDRVFKTGKTQQEQSQLTEKDTSVAEKRSLKAEEKTSDYYSMSEHTDHEESLPMQQQNSWPEDEDSSRESSRSGSSNLSPESDGENSRKGLPKRTLEFSMENLTISTDLNATKAEQHSPIKKFRSN